MKNEEGSYELDLTWEELEEQREVNELKSNPIPPRRKKYT